MIWRGTCKKPATFFFKTCIPLTCIAFLITVFSAHGCGGGGNGFQAPATGNTGSVEGRVILTTEDLPAKSSLRQTFAGYRVTVQDAESSAPVNEDGAFRVEGVPTGMQVVSVLGEMTEKAAHVLVDVAPGRTSNVGFIIPRPSGRIKGEISGLNVNIEQHRLANAKIIATPLATMNELVSNLSNGRPQLSARSNGNGEYVISGVVAGTYLLTGIHSGFKRGTQIVEVQPRAAASANFVLREAGTGGGSIRGIVVTERESRTTPLRDVLILISPIEGPPGPPFGGQGAGGTAGVSTLELEQLSASELTGLLPAATRVSRGLLTKKQDTRYQNEPIFAITSADGRFEFDGLAPGHYSKLFLKDGFVSEPLGPEPPLGEGEILDLTIKMRPVRLGQITGSVTWSQTHGPIESVSVVAYSSNDPFTTPPLLPASAASRLLHDLSARLTAGLIAERPPVRYFTETDSRGIYQLVVLAGHQQVRIHPRGIEGQGREVDVAVGETVTVNFEIIGPEILR